MINRHRDNPLLTRSSLSPTRPDFRVVGVFNPGVARVAGDTILLLRVAEAATPVPGESAACPVYDESTGILARMGFPADLPGLDLRDPRIISSREQNYLTSHSHFRVARSRDGVRFVIDPEPAMTAATPYESFGIEDPRITEMDDGYYIVYSSASRYGIVASLAKTRDFRSFERLGVLFPPDNKDVTLFPGPIDGRYFALHRPSHSLYGRPEIWIAESPDLRCWGHHRRLAGVRPGHFDSGRVGASAVPFLTDRGWIEIYHGATPENRYCLGVLLLDASEPWKVLARSREPLAAPEAPYEKEGFFGDVVFSCGCLRDGDTIRIYYGAADDSVALLTMDLGDLFDTLVPVEQEPNRSTIE